MMIPARKCPTCRAAVEGPPTKLFCNQACKGRYAHRSALAEPAGSGLESAASGPVAPPRDARGQESPAAGDDEREAVEAQVRQDQAQATRLHARFCALVKKVLDDAGRDVPAKRLLSLRREANSLLRAYTVHPLRKRPDTQIKCRLQALYCIYDAVHEAMAEMNGRLIWRSDIGSFEVSKKWRKHMRELLPSD